MIHGLKIKYLLIKHIFTDSREHFLLLYDNNFYYMYIYLSNVTSIKNVEGVATSFVNLIFKK